MTPIARAAVLLLLLLPYALASRQGVLISGHKDMMSSIATKPTLQLDTRWRVLGPIQAGMRESHLGAFFPLAFRSPHDLFGKQSAKAEVTYSTLVPGARGRIESFTATEEQHREDTVSHNLHIQYPDADWKGVRSTMGWAALQWQALCMSELTVTSEKGAHVEIRATAPAAASFAFLKEEQFSDPVLFGEVQWYNGDWYSYTAQGQNSANSTFTHWLTLAPGTYRMLVKAVHEVRIHGAGDPQSGPAIDFQVALQVTGGREGIEGREHPLAVLSDRTVAPDIVSGTFAGWGVGLALQNVAKQDVHVAVAGFTGESSKYLEVVSEGESITIAPGQIRPIKVRIAQYANIPSAISDMTVAIKLILDEKVREIVVKVPIEHVKAPKERACDKDEISSWTFTYLDADGTVQLAATIPPLRLYTDTNSIAKPTPMTLYLHGAGVNIQERPSQQVLRRQCESWVVMPSGRTPWGTDWQGLSRDSIDRAAEQFKTHMYGFSTAERQRLRIPSTDQYMLVGHSNGGQGVYQYASHCPDKVIGAVIAAGYIRMADYVPLIWQRSRHFVEAALEGVLRSSLNPYESNLFASNLAGIPITIKHGDADENVPTWHSREMTGLVADWNRNSGLQSRDFVSYSEFPGKPHFWDGMMQEDDVQAAIDARVTDKHNPGYAPPPQLATFTLTVASPDESGSKQGWRVLRLPIPGRLGRLTIHYIGSAEKTVHVRTSNVDRLVFQPSHYAQLGSRVVIDKQAVDDAEVRNAALRNAPLQLTKEDGKTWSIVRSSVDESQAAMLPEDRALGPAIRFLQSYGGPIQIIVPRARCDQSTTERYLSIARRFSNDAFVYNGLDSVISYDDEVQPRQLGAGNILILGGPSINVVAFFSAAKQEIFTFEEDSPYFAAKGTPFGEGFALLALMPDPIDQVNDGLLQRGDSTLIDTSAKKRMTMLLHGTTAGAIEQAAALLPLRTGSMLPEWIVFGAQSADSRTSQWQGYGSIAAAGWYDYYWGYSSTMSYFY